MNWSTEQHKKAKTRAFHWLNITVVEMKTYSACDAESWIRSFNERIREIPQANHFAMWHLYKAIEVNWKTVEIYSINIHGELQKKMYTITRP